MNSLFLVFQRKRQLEAYHNLALTLLSGEHLQNREAKRVLMANLLLELYVEALLASYLSPKELVIPEWV